MAMQRCNRAVKACVLQLSPQSSDHQRAASVQKS